MNIVKRRIIAFLIDVFIVSFIVSLIINNNTMNSNSDISKRLDRIINDYSSEKISTREYMKEYSSIIYEINQDNFDENVIYLVVSIGYFLVFQYLNGGATIGKRILKLRIVNKKKKKKISIWQLFIRVGLINQIFCMILLIIITKSLSGYGFLIGYGAVSTIKSILFIICGMMLLFNKNNISLHDKLSYSQVIIEKSDY